MTIIARYQAADGLSIQQTSSVQTDELQAHICKHNFKITGEVNNNLVMLQCSSGKPRDLAFMWMSQHPLLKAKDAHHGYSGTKCLQQDRVSANGHKKGSGPTSTTAAKATQPLNSPSKLEK